MTKDLGKHLAKKQGYALCSFYKLGNKRLDHKGYKGNSTLKKEGFSINNFFFSNFICSTKRQPLPTKILYGKKYSFIHPRTRREPYYLVMA